MSKKCKITLIGDLQSPAEVADAFARAGVAIDLASVAIEPLVEKELVELVETSEKQLQKSEDYLDDLVHFYAEAELVCAEYQVANPYVESVRKALKKKPVSAAETKNLHSLEELAQRANTLSLIRKYLVDLPKSADFEELRFAQNLLKINLDLPKTLLRPKRLDETVLQAFESYRKLYVKKYLELFAERAQAFAAFRKEEKDLRQKILTLKTLDEIPVLGVPLAAGFAAELEKLRTEAILEEVSEEVLKKALEKSPTWRDVFFDTPSAQILCDDFHRRLQNALENKFALIRNKSVLDILAVSRKDPVQKLVKLLQLTKIDNIVKLFNTKTAVVIGHELKKLLAPAIVDTVRLGDFRCRVEKIDNADDIAAAAADFKHFLEKQKAAKKHLFLQ